MDATSTWWTLLVTRLQSAPASTRAGTVQLEVKQAHGPARYFHLTVGDQPVVGAGLAAHTDAWILTDDDALGACLRGAARPGSLGTLGDADLVDALFASLGTDAPLSPLSTRWAR